MREQNKVLGTFKLVYGELKPDGTAGYKGLGKTLSSKIYKRLEFHQNCKTGNPVDCITQLTVAKDRTILLQTCCMP